MKKAVVAGHICIDITPMFPPRKASDMASIFKPGKLVQMGDVDVHTGGAVANTGLAMKILGADVTLMGKIGRDSFGDMILNILKKYDADKGMIRVEGESTSYSVVLAVPGFDRIFLHNPGANDTFVCDDVKDEALKDVALFHFGYPPIMHNMFINDGAELVKLFRKVKKMGIATSLDMTQIDPDTEAGRADWDAILKNLLPYVDFFVPSVEELGYMLDKEAFETWQQRAGGGDITPYLDPDNDIRPLAHRCIEYGAKVVLIKSGAPGMYYKVTDDESRLKETEQILGLAAADWIGKEGFAGSFKPSKVVSGTGAGDTSIAAFLTSILKGESFENCLDLALATGASCVEAIDALGGLKSLEELKEKIRLGWERN